MADKKRYSFFITAPQAEALKRLKDLEGTAEAESIRQALNEYLAKKGVLRSTSVRALLGRRSMGFDVSEKYLEIGRRRIRKAQNRPPLALLERRTESRARQASLLETET